MSALKKTSPTLSLAAGMLVVGALSPGGDTLAAENPFSSSRLPGGYMIAADDMMKGKEGKCGEGKCGGAKDEKEAVCGIYSVGSAHKDDSKVKDGKCGGHKVVEALCGGDR